VVGGSCTFHPTPRRRKRGQEKGTEGRKEMGTFNFFREEKK
jgi:hypothetical protein